MNLHRINVVLGLGIATAIICGPATVGAATWKVGPDEAITSIQAAVDAASPGDRIVVMPGTYVGQAGSPNAVTVDKDDITLIGRERRREGEAGKVKIVPHPDNDHGVVADGGAPETPLQGFKVRGFTVEGFEGNGIWTRYVNDFKIIRNESRNNLENGIFPTLSANGLVRRNISYGAQDTSLWVEASENIRVIRNEFYGSPTGLEITVSNNVIARANDVHDNAVGIGLYHPDAASLPKIPVMANWVIERNRVYNNNGPNNAPPNTMSADLPVGGGILVLGVDENVIRNNRIENNDFFGIAVVDWCLAQSQGAFNCTDNPPSYDEFPDDNLFIGNKLTGNGSCALQDCQEHAFSFAAKDIAYIVAAARGNCFKRNTFTTFISTLVPDLILPTC